MGLSPFVLLLFLILAVVLQCQLVINDRKKNSKADAFPSYLLSAGISTPQSSPEDHMRLIDDSFLIAFDKEPLPRIADAFGSWFGLE